MNEEELKDLWQTDRHAPTIDFARIEKLSIDWRKRLRRKVIADIWAQILATIAGVLLFIFYPGLLFFSLTVIALGIWYVRELRGLYQTESGESEHLPVRDLLNLKIRTFENYFRRTRFVMYVITPLMIASALYGLGFFTFSSIVSGEKTVFLLACFVGYEVIAFGFSEIYFKILYTPALNELKNLLMQLEIEEE